MLSLCLMKNTRLQKHITSSPQKCIYINRLFSMVDENQRAKYFKMRAQCSQLSLFTLAVFARSPSDEPADTTIEPAQGPLYSPVCSPSIHFMSANT